MPGFIILSGLPEDLKTVKEKLKEYAERLKAKGYMTCFSCGRFAGLDYKLENGERIKITLRKMRGKYICQVCIAEAMIRQKEKTKAG